MLIDTRQARLPLIVGRVARLHHARASRVTALRGSAWITIDNDRRDIVLAPGESFVVDTDAGVLVHPLWRGQAIELLIDGPAARPVQHGGAAALWSRLCRALMPAPALAAV